MILQGTLVNIAAVVAGCLIGRLAGRYLSARMRQTLMIGLGLAVLLIGLQLALQSKQLMIVIGGLIFGGLIGEMIGIEKRLEEFGERLQKRFSGMGKIAEGFVTASLLYCVGAMAIMGALQDGLGGPPTILYAKAALDGVASIALTSTLGIGVIFSVIPLLFYQGGIALAAELADHVIAWQAAAGWQIPLPRMLAIHYLPTLCVSVRQSCATGYSGLWGVVLPYPAQ